MEYYDLEEKVKNNAYVNKVPYPVVKKPSKPVIKESSKYYEKVMEEYYEELNEYRVAKKNYSEGANKVNQDFKDDVFSVLKRAGANDKQASIIYNLVINNSSGISNIVNNLWDYLNILEAGRE